MNVVRAIWTNGRILPSGPVDWPDGSELIVEPVATAEQIGIDESEWQDDAESIAAWLARVDAIPPRLLDDEERTESERYREEHRRFNIDAVRKQMGLGDQS